MSDQAQPQRPGASLNLEGLTLEKIEQKLSESYNDPVQSRLLEAARAQLILNEQETQESMSRGHVDIHAW